MMSQISNGDWSSSLTVCDTMHLTVEKSYFNMIPVTIVYSINYISRCKCILSYSTMMSNWSQPEKSEVIKLASYSSLWCICITLKWKWQFCTFSISNLGWIVFFMEICIRLNVTSAMWEKYSHEWSTLCIYMCLWNKWTQQWFMERHR